MERSAVGLAVGRAVGGAVAFGRPGAFVAGASVPGWPMRSSARAGREALAGAGAPTASGKTGDDEDADGARREAS